MNALCLLDVIVIQILRLLLLQIPNSDNSIVGLIFMAYIILSS